jgi:hypothetical protein
MELGGGGRSADHSIFWSWPESKEYMLPERRQLAKERPVQLCPNHKTGKM